MRLLVRRSNNRATDLRAADIARAIGQIAERYPNGLRSLILPVNHFARQT